MFTSLLQIQRPATTAQKPLRYKIVNPFLYFNRATPDAIEISVDQYTIWLTQAGGRKHYPIAYFFGNTGMLRIQSIWIANGEIKQLTPQWLFETLHNQAAFPHQLVLNLQNTETKALNRFHRLPPLEQCNRLLSAMLTSNITNGNELLSTIQIILDSNYLTQSPKLLALATSRLKLLEVGHLTHDIIHNYSPKTTWTKVMQVIKLLNDKGIYQMEPETLLQCL